MSPPMSRVSDFLKTDIYRQAKYESRSERHFGNVKTQFTTCKSFLKEIHKSTFWPNEA